MEFERPQKTSLAAKEITALYMVVLAVLGGFEEQKGKNDFAH